MRKSVFLIVFLCAISVTHAQDADKADRFTDSINYWLQQKDYVKALVYLDSLAVYQPDDIELFEMMQDLSYRIENYQKAFTASAQLVKLEPGRAIRYSGAGWYAVLANQPARAIYYLQTAIHMDPGYFAYLNIGHAYALLRQTGKMFYYYQYALEYLPQQERIESGVVDDIRLLKKLKLYPYDTTQMIDEVRSIASQYHESTEANAIMDSIFRLLYVHNEAPLGEKVIEMKRQYCEAETKNKIWRYHVLGEYYWQIGMAETRQRNETKAMAEYLLPSLRLSYAAGDSLAIIQKWIEYGQYGTTPYHELLDSAILLAQQCREPGMLLKAYWAKADARKKRYQWDDVLKYARLAYQLAQKISPADVYELEFGKETAIASSAERLYDAFLVKRMCDSALYFYDISSKYFLEKYPSLHNRFSTAENLAMAYYKCGNYNESIARANAALTAFSKYHKEIDLSGLHELVGLCYYKLGQLPRAGVSFRESIDVYRRFTEEVKDKRGLRVVNAHCETSFEHLKRIYLQQKNTEALFAVSEEAKLNVMYLYLESSYFPKTTRTSKETWQDLAADEAVLSFGSSGRMSWGYGIGITKEKTLLNNEEAARFEKLYTALSNLPVGKKINTYSEAVLKATGNTSPNADDIATAKLGILSILFNSSIGGSTAARGLTIKGSGNSTAENDLNAMNRLLYDYFVAPFESLLAGKKTIYISGEQATNYFPFEVLKNKEGNYMGELYNIVYVPSFTIQHHLKKREEGSSNSIMAIGNAAYSSFDATEMNGRAYDMATLGYSNWSDLPGTKQEIETLQAVSTNTVLVQDKAVSETSINAMSESGKLKHHKFLHFALHGMMKLDDYQDNALIVTEPKGSRKDGFLQFWEIASLDIHARLACLSACETAVSSFEANNDLNLPVAFMMAGANSVLASSWKIDDKATGIFMGEFYKKIFAGRSPSEALYLTRKQFIAGEFGEAYKAPVFWGAFKYTGY